MYKISIQYTNPFKRYRMETKSVTYGTDSGDTICTPLPSPPPPPIENGRGIKIVSYDRTVADLHIPFYQSCHQYFAFWLFSEH